MENLLHLALIWAGVFLAGYLARKTKLTPVLYFLAIGCLMVNTGLLPEETTPFIGGLSEIGIIVIMFALGFEEKINNFLSGIKRSWGIALFGAIGPFLIAYSVASYFWHDINIALLCGLTMSATTVSLSMVSLKSEGLQGSKAATGIMTSAVLDNIAALALVAVLIPIATGDTTVDSLSIGVILARAVFFFVIVAVIGLILFPHDLSESRLGRIPLLGRFGLRDLMASGGGEHATLFILLLAVSLGILSHKFGLHPAVGAYMAGLIIREEYFLFPAIEENQYQSSKRIIDNVAFSWIGPVFFVDLGAKLIFDWEIVVSVIPETLVLTLCVMAGQILSAGLAARYTGKFSLEESVMIGFGMLGRAELAFVVMDIAYVQNDIFTIEVFYTLMFTAFWLNVAVPVSIRLWKPYFVAAQAQ
jgi:Kef-type K+ transport system membrane component KefB